MTRRRTEDTREAAWWLAAMALFIMAYGCALTGCGASAIQTHARTAGIAAIALRGVNEAAKVAELAAIEACQDEACIDAVERATDAADAAAASVRVTLTAYVEGVRMAQVAEEGADLMSALIAMGARLFGEWSTLRDALAFFGVDVMSLPGGGS